MIIITDKEKFLKLCQDVLNKCGKPAKDIVILGKENIEGKIYEDEIVYMAISDDMLFMEVERKNNNNPIIYIEDGNIILFNVEYLFLQDHIKTLLK